MNALSLRRPRPGLGWLHLPLCLLSVTLAPAASSQTAPAPTAATAPAQRLFNQVNALVQERYGGLSTVDRLALTREYQARLDAVCAPVPSSCPADRAYPVIQAEITALNDEHSFFQTPEDYADFVTSATGGNRLQFGVKLGELDGQNRVILEVIAQSAAAEAGLRRGDVLLTLDGKPYVYDDLHQARLDGRTIQLGLERQGQRLNLNLTPRQSSSLDLPRLTYTGNAQNIAVLRIPTFLSGGGVGQRVHDLIGEAKARGIQGLVVDLRGDTGGSLNECDSAVSAFVPDFTRVARTPEGDVRTRVSQGLRLEDGHVGERVRAPQIWTGPVAVLVDRDSASCSEFFAFEIQYAARGPVIGEETAGVGNTATAVYPLPDSSALQLTITHYVKPDGTPYPRHVTPDERFDTTEDDMRRLTQGEDTVLNAALKALEHAPRLGSQFLP